MRIVTAGVHHAAFDAAGGRRGAGRGVGQAGLLGHRQPVHVGAQHDDGAGPVLHHRDDAGAADALGHREAQLARDRRQLGGGLVFLEAELGIGVEVAVERHQLGHVGAEIVAQIVGRGGRRDRGGEDGEKRADGRHGRFPRV